MFLMDKMGSGFRVSLVDVPPPLIGDESLD